jgi:hypothetical protein
VVEQREVDGGDAELGDVLLHVADDHVGVRRAWEERVRSARGFKRVGRHSDYAI